MTQVMLRRPPSSAWTGRRTNNGNDGGHGVQGAAYKESTWRILYFVCIDFRAVRSNRLFFRNMFFGSGSKASMYSTVTRYRINIPLRRLVVVPRPDGACIQHFWSTGFSLLAGASASSNGTMFRCRFSRERPQDAASAAVSEKVRAKLYAVIARTCRSESTPPRK
jgi:hypothetical protein